MNRPIRRAGPIRRTLTAGMLAGVGGATGACGAESGYVNMARPATPIVVTAVTDDQRVRLSPRSFGAGPIVLIIANESRRAQEFTLETAGGAGGSPGIRETTSPVNPSTTAELKVQVEPGTYRLSVAARGIRPAVLRVGKPRPSAQNELLQP